MEENKNTKSKRGIDLNFIMGNYEMGLILAKQLKREEQYIVGFINSLEEGAKNLEENSNDKTTVLIAIDTLKIISGPEPKISEDLKQLFAIYKASMNQKDIYGMWKSELKELTLQSLDFRMEMSKNQKEKKEIELVKQLIIQDKTEE